MLEKILTIKDLSERTGMTQNYIFNCCLYKPETIPKFFILHGLRRFKESDVEDWMKQNKTPS